jgi:hypothetical protein
MAEGLDVHSTSKVPNWDCSILHHIDFLESSPPTFRPVWNEKTPAKSIGNFSKRHYQQSMHVQAR